jgi:hypothetical protein
MQLPLTTLIAGKKTVEDWISISAELIDFENNTLWLSVFNDYFLTRLNDRYLNPINSIKEDGVYRGEGFSIMTIICSIVEFLETTYQGINYRFIRRGDSPLTSLEYDKSGIIFNSFLTHRLPFKDYFDNQLAEDFYGKVRCSLLHEARTSGKWTIWGSSSNGLFVEKRDIETIIYRDDFYQALLDFVNIHYKNELLISVERKQAFLRKFNRLCEE